MTDVQVQNSTTGRSKRRAPLAAQAARSGIGVLSRVAPELASAIALRLFLTPRRHPRPAAEHELLDRARAFTVPTARGPLAAWEWGTEGPRVLLVHGWEGRGAQLGALVEPLTMLGFRVVTFDGPAHGTSPGNRASLFDLGEAVTQVADACGPLHAIVTHSMGGAATLWALRRRVLADRFVMIAPPVDLRDFSKGFARALGFSEDVRGRLHRRIVERFGVPIEDVRAERLAAGMTAPLLVVHDEDDRDVPVACGEAIAGAWPGAELVRTRGLGHRRILSDGGVVRTVVRFLASPRRSERAA